MIELQAINDIWQRGVMATVIFLLAILGVGIVVALVKPWLKRQYALMSAAWLRASLSGKILLPLLVAVDVLVGGGKPIGARSADINPTSQPLLQLVEVVSGYNAPVEGVPDEDVFEKPDASFTPSRWQGIGVCDDWQLMPGGMSACVGGVVATQGFGSSDWDCAATNVSVYAPFMDEHSLLPGVSDFWCITNALYKRFVWKNVANRRDPSRLVSFAAQVSESGDVAYVYNDAASASTNRVSFFQAGGERMFFIPNQTNACAILIERDLSQHTRWWVSRYPDSCYLNDQEETVWTYDEEEYYRISADLSSAFEEEQINVNRSLQIELSAKTGFVYLDADGILNDQRHQFSRGAIALKDVLLKTGVAYEVTGFVLREGGKRPCKIAGITTDTSGVAIIKISDYKYIVWRKIHMSIVPSTKPTNNCIQWQSSLSPHIDGGFYSWSATGPFSVVSPRAKSTEVFRTAPGSGSLKCVWSKGGIAVTNSVALTSTDMTHGDEYFGLMFDNPVILKEAAHLDVSGNAVQASNPSARMALTYSGNTPGTIEISSNNSDVRLRDGSAIFELPIRINVSASVNRTWEVELAQVQENVHEIEFESRFIPDGNDLSFERQATLHLAQLTVEAEASWPGELRRHVFGPCENAMAIVEPGNLRVRWRNGNSQPVEASVFQVAAPNEVGLRNLQVEIEGASFTIPLRYIAPVGVAADSARAMNSSDWAALGDPEPAVGKVGVGLYTQLHLEPSYVSFTNVWIREGYSPAIDRVGYFSRVPVSPHNEANGAGLALQIMDGNGFIDRAGYSNNAVTQAPEAGSFRFEIPMCWSADNVSYTQFCVNTQSYESFPEGGLRVTKFGCSCRRELDGSTTITRSGGQ